MRRHETFERTQQNHQRATRNLQANAITKKMTSTYSSLFDGAEITKNDGNQHTKNSNTAEKNWRRSLPLSIAQSMKQKIEDTRSLPTPTYNGSRKRTSPQLYQSLSTRASLQVRHMRKNTNINKNSNNKLSSGRWTKQASDWYKPSTIRHIL